MGRTCIINGEAKNTHKIFGLKILRGRGQGIGAKLILKWIIFVQKL
jgi:hypothetical protein